MQDAVINVNGEIFTPPEAIHQARVSVFDRSYLYGDSLYEVVRSYGDHLFSLREHLARLTESAKLCQMSLSQTAAQYEHEIKRTFLAFKEYQQKMGQKGDAYIRLVVSRGEGKIGFSVSCLTTPTRYTIIVQAVHSPSAQEYEKGMKLAISTRLRNDRRALDPAMKSGNYLNSLLAYLEANETGYQDALLCNADGEITEGTTFNVFYVKRGILVTPPLEVGILDGITRKIVIHLARKNEIRVREVRFPKDRLFQADEVFITSSIREIFPVSSIDDKLISKGKPGPVTRKLHQYFDAYRSEL